MQDLNTKEPSMAILSYRSNRFSRSYNYNLPEYRNPAPRGHKSRISVVVPATHERAPQERGNGNDAKR